MSSEGDPFLASEYGILQVIPGHKGDVRSVSPYPGGGVLTGSSDKTSKLYLPEDKNNQHSELQEVQNFLGPTEFVTSICCGKTKAGELEIYVGSHDSHIYIYTLIEGKPTATLSRHSDRVCTLAFRICDDEDVLVSGSWDQTAVIWRNREPAVTLYGHVHAIWDVAFVARSFILTAGADKSIKKWDVKDGSMLHIYNGHSDCVRGLAVISGQQFLSCSNDQTVILWTIGGDILKQFTAHENFIYDIAIVRQPLQPGVEPPKNRPFKIVTVSEDKTLRVWDKDGNMLQTIPIQSSTLWSIAALDNGNFVIGTSDGITYIFSNVKPISK